MAVRDPHRDSGLFRGHEREHADRVHMGVHDARVNLLEQFPAGIHVLDWVAVWRNVEHSTAQGLDLVLGNHRGVSLHNEIELHLRAVDMAVMIHHGGFDTTTHHPADYLGHANRHWITVPEPQSNRRNGRYRLFVYFETIRKMSKSGFEQGLQVTNKQSVHGKPVKSTPEVCGGTGCV